MDATLSTIVPLGLVLLVGCTSHLPLPEVAAYTSLDAEFAEPVYKEFKRTTGITVLPTSTRTRTNQSDWPRRNHRRSVAAASRRFLE